MNDLQKLFRRGILVDSPDFIQEKQPDGRYQIKLKPPGGPSAVIPVLIPRGTITVEAFITKISPAAEYHLGPGTWILIPDSQEITQIGQYKVNRDPLYFPLFKAGVDIGAGFEIAPNYVSLGHVNDVAARFVQVFARNDTTDWSFEINTGGDGQIEAPIDLSSGVFDHTYLTLFNYIIRIIVTYTRGVA